jgi:hypothetical protein
MSRTSHAELAFESVSLSVVAAALGTPTYVYSKRLETLTAYDLR